MLAAVCMTTVYTIGVAFYARFVFALCKECRRERISYLVRLRIDSAEHVIREHRVSDTQLPRAA